MNNPAGVRTGGALPVRAFTRQDWTAYSNEDHGTWEILFRRRMDSLAQRGSVLYLTGADAIGLSAGAIPDLDDVNRRLRDLTGWRAQPVTGYLEPADFFRCLARRVFPTTVTIRPRARLDYLPEPDIFHDVFGHVPLHADATFAAVLQRMGELGLHARRPDHLTWVTRLFWFTVEFGLVQEGGAPKIYGSGLVSSAGDAATALGPDCERRPFQLDDVIAQPFVIDRMQDVLYVVDGFPQLYQAATELARRIAADA